MGSECQPEPQRRGPIIGLAYDTEIAAHGKKVGQASPHHGMVVNE